STVNVAANGTATVNIQTLPPSSTGLNLTRPAFGVRLGRGISNVLTLGGEDITAGVSFSPSSPGIFLGIPSGAFSRGIVKDCFGGRISVVASTSAKMDISVPATTALGPKNIAVSRNGDTSVLSGAVVITDAAPANVIVAPASGPVDGGTSVTI